MTVIPTLLILSVEITALPGHLLCMNRTAVMVLYIYAQKEEPAMYILP